MERLRRSISGFLVVIAALAPGVAPVSAQGPEPAFRLGDRVEIDVAQAKNPAESVWKKGTVIDVNVPALTYAVQVDTAVIELPEVLPIPIRFPEQWIRVLHGSDSGPPQTVFRAKNEAPDGTVLPDRPTLNCVVMQTPVANGTPPPTALITLLIRCLYEQPPMPGADGAVTMDINSYRIGASRQWNMNTDAMSGNSDTVVFPVQTVWTWKTFYRAVTMVQTNESIFNCYVNSLESWECAVGQRLKNGVIRRLVVR